jgi:hypothetical protein
MAIMDFMRKVRVDSSDRYVLQYWVGDLPWKMQTVLIQGLRAPDTHFCKNTKIVCRWMRSMVLRNADKNHTFMCKKDGLPTPEDLENELNYCSMHCVTHFLYALEIIGYRHPDKEVRRIAYNLYKDLVWGIMHFNVEASNDLHRRLSDVDREIEVQVCPPESKDRYIRQ